MANLKIRGIRESCEAKGPQNGPAQDRNVGAMGIENCPADGRQVPYPSSGPCYQPGSSLGAKQISHPTPKQKA